MNLKCCRWQKSLFTGSVTLHRLMLSSQLLHDSNCPTYLTVESQTFNMTVCLMFTLLDITLYFSLLKISRS